MSAVKPAYWIAGVLLAATVIAPLIVSTYAKAEPRLWGFPFFYWYQLLWVVLSVFTVGIAYKLVMGEERKRRAAQGLGDPDKPAKEADR
nr:DUF3311 domain-containing protein [Kribbella sandramycini]